MAVINLPVIGPLVARIGGALLRLVFPGSKQYWESRYARGGTSGSGSYGVLAEFKAEVLNGFVRERGVRSIIEFGCGDGAQLSLATYPTYIGLDVSRTAIARCKERFEHDKTKSFFLYDPCCFVDRYGIFRAELALSLDVIFHLIEDEVFEAYIRHLFDAAEKFVVVYSSDIAQPSPVPHFKHRRFSEWVKQEMPLWTLVKRIPNRYPYKGDERRGSVADFFFYEKV